VNQERGSLSVLLAGYLALAVLIGVSMAAVGISLVAKNRIQAVADSAVLYAHDRAVKKGIPDRAKLQTAIQKFFETAPSAKQLHVAGIELKVIGAESQLVLCARHRDSLGVAINSGLICRTASAKSFRVD